MFGVQKDIFTIPGLDEPEAPEKAVNLNNSYISRAGSLSQRGPRSRRNSVTSNNNNRNFNTSNDVDEDPRKSKKSRIGRQSNIEI